MSGEESWEEQLATLGTFIRSLRRAGGLSLRDLADLTGVSNAYLSQIERGLHEPSLRVLQAIAAALGISLDVLLSRAGMLSSEATAPLEHDTEAAIMHDRQLSEPQRFALLSVYRSFTPAASRRRA